LYLCFILASMYRDVSICMSPSYQIDIDGVIITTSFLLAASTAQH